MRPSPGGSAVWVKSRFFLYGASFRVERRGMRQEFMPTAALLSAGSCRRKGWNLPMSDRLERVAIAFDRDAL
jgi:hypothetical protein